MHIIHFEYSFSCAIDIPDEIACVGMVEKLIVFYFLKSVIQSNARRSFRTVSSRMRRGVLVVISIASLRIYVARLVAQIESNDLRATKYSRQESQIGHGDSRSHRLAHTHTARLSNKSSSNRILIYLSRLRV